MPKGGTEMEVGPDGVAVIAVANPPVNALSIDVLYSLKCHYEEALRRNDVKAIVLTGKGGIFSAGLDLSAFADIQRNKPEQLKVGYMWVDVMTDIIEDAGKPSVAAIDGLALGGGLEVSMVCQARISTPNAQFVLPDFQIGLIPGFGGTQRLPRLVGLKKALEMLMFSKRVKAEEAHDLGLVDHVVLPNDLLNVARRWALDISESKRPWVRALYNSDKLESPEEAGEILNFARAQARKQAANLCHRLVCIDVIEEGIISGPRAGLRKEAISFQKLFLSDTCKSLVHVFFSQRATSKVPGITDLGLMPQNLSKVAIVGGGLMGSGIATTLILNDYPVILKEVNEKLLSAGINRIKGNLQSRVSKGKMTEEKYEKTLSLLTGVLDYEKFKSVDLVIEAVLENVKLKQKIFAELERHCPSHCVLATNTSTIDLNLIGEKTNSQDRIVGAHFFTLADLVGFGVALATDMQYLENFPERVYKSMLIPLMIEDKRTGEASGKGFYKYERKRKAKPDPEITNYVEESKRMAGAMHDPELLKLDDSAIAERVFYPVINEACRVLGEGIAVKASDLDIASIFGMGFPPYRGGIMYWADSVGARCIHTKLLEWAAKYGQFFEPCTYLTEREAGGVPLSAPAMMVTTNQAKGKL